ncbi:hypothetical protein [Kordia sp.]|uniref:hypothetical protein n=1 Tax=Kordia sp. TaxID=1965332 RepID=UPI0025BB2078|nr:hypothetical protein [Kordia sp.]MCH2195018.1 hypothetical protein [Kordia sp.]
MRKFNLKTSKKIYIVLFILTSSSLFYSCSNPRWATDVGLNVTWGPNGPKVRPHVDLDLYNGGRL